MVFEEVKEEVIMAVIERILTCAKGHRVSDSEILSSHRGRFASAMRRLSSQQHVINSDGCPRCQKSKRDKRSSVDNIRPQR